MRFVAAGSGARSRSARAATAERRPGARPRTERPSSCLLDEPPSPSDGEYAGIPLVCRRSVPATGVSSRAERPHKRVEQRREGDLRQTLVHRHPSGHLAVACTRRRGRRPRLPGAPTRRSRSAMLGAAAARRVGDSERTPTTAPPRRAAAPAARSRRLTSSSPKARDRGRTSRTSADQRSTADNAERLRPGRIIAEGSGGHHRAGRRK